MLLVINFAKNSFLIFICFFVFLSSDDKVDNIIIDFHQAIQNDDEDLSESVKERLEVLIKKDGYSIEISSYLGSITAKMATYTMFPWSKLSYSEDGSRMLDKAIKINPNNLVVRLNRIFTYMNFPDFLKKSHFIIKDARFLVNLLNQQPNHKAKNTIAEALSKFFIKEKNGIKFNKYYSMITDKKIKNKVDKFKGKL